MGRDGEKQVFVSADLSDPADGVVFGPFRFLAGRRRLERDGAPVPLGGKAFDILKVLLERPGEVVTKPELLRQVWPGAIADEGSLRFHIAALRKALGEGRYIANVAGQGYSFVAAIGPAADAPAPEAKAPPLRLPPRPRRLVGREEVIETLGDQLLAHRFVTVVGPGGVGKTSVVLALAHDLALEFEGDVCFFDVGSVFDPTLFVGGLASALGIPMKGAGAFPGVIPFLRKRRMLLILDGCEPNVEAAAAIAEDICREAPQVHLLATSREALRAEGEYVHRLFPLSYPAVDAGRTAEEALAYSAVQLFVDRVASIQHGFALTDEDASRVGQICRKLDGLALAIELAAGRVEAYGVREVSRQLDSQFALMWPGRRTAVARHQTLKATLGWSHQLLSAREQVVFRRLCVFAGPFTLKMATAVVQDAELPLSEVTELLGGLVAKSLVQFGMDSQRDVYRLLDITRSYAFEKLSEAGEVQIIADRHAEFVRQRLEAAPAEEDGGLSPVELLGDVRVALEWSFSPQGDLARAGALAAASAPIWLQCGLLNECHFWMARTLEASKGLILDPQRKLAIQSAFASSLLFTQGFSEASYQSWAHTLTTAQSLDCPHQQLAILLVMWGYKIRSPNYPEALALAQKAQAFMAAVEDTGKRALGDGILGISYHHLGELETARPLLEQALAGDTPQARQEMRSQYGYDRRVPQLATLSNLYWLEGRPGQALRLSAMGLAEARRSPHPVPLCGAMTWHALTLHLRGDPPAEIAPLLDEAISYAQAHFIESYEGFALALRGLNLVARGDIAATATVAEGLKLLSKTAFEAFHPLFRTECGRLKVEAGLRLAEFEIADLLQFETYPEHWASAEVRRNLGEILLLHGRPDRAEGLFRHALDQAERQGARAWGLRAALSLARMGAGGTPSAEARRLLETLCGQIIEGETTVDVRAARRFLAGHPRLDRPNPS